VNLEILKYDDSRTLAAKRLHILNSAYRLFLEKGIDPVTMVAIASAAGVTRRTLYNYYENRDLIAEDLQILTVEKVNWFDRLRNRLSPGSDLFEALMGFARELLKFHLDEMRFITKFDNYFADSYPSDKFPRYLADRFSTLDREIEVPSAFVTIIQVYLAYLQRLVMIAGDSAFDYAEHEEHIALFTRTIVRGFEGMT
jgi:AcrR family transcriptional regulator